MALRASVGWERIAAERPRRGSALPHPERRFLFGKQAIKTQNEKGVVTRAKDFPGLCFS